MAIYNWDWLYEHTRCNIHKISSFFYCLSFSEDNDCCLAVLWFYERE